MGVADVGIDAAAVEYRLDDGSEVVVGQNHGGGILTYLGAGNAHGHTHVSLLQAGASLTPSPVMAAMQPRRCQAVTMRILCSGETRA